MRESFAVFKGEFLSQTKKSLRTEIGKWPVFVVRLRATRVYKGPAQPVFVIQTATHTAACGFPFQSGKYLVYAYGKSLDSLGTGICTRTRALAHAAADLRYLRGEPPEAEDLITPEEKEARSRGLTRETSGTLCGRVRTADGQPLQGIQVIAWAADEPKKAVKFVFADARGAYQIRFLPPGKYLLSAIHPPWWGHDDRAVLSGFYPNGTTAAEASPVEVQPGTERCSLDFEIRRWRGFTVSVRASLADKRWPRSGITVRLESLDFDKEPFARRRYAFETDLDGQLRFRNVPAGRYFLSADSNDGRYSSPKVEIEVRKDLEISLTLNPKKQ